MNLEDDFEEDDWRRKRTQNHQLYDEELEQIEQQPVIVSLNDDDLEMTFNQSVLIAGAKSKRQFMRDERSTSSTRIPFSMQDTCETIETLHALVGDRQNVQDVSDSPVRSTIIELSNDEDDSAWQSVVSSRISRFAGHNITEETFEPASYRPSAPIPPLQEAKEAFMTRVNAKREQLQQKDRERMNAELERTRLMEELQGLKQAIHEAQQVVSTLEMSI